MKTPTIPTLLGPDGMTSLREYAGYHGGGSGFGGQLRAWNPPGESVDAALLPNFTRAMPAQTIWYAITAMPPTPSSCIRIISSGLFSGSVIAQAGAIWASGRKKPVPFPARLKRHGKSLPRMTAAALTLSENARLP